MAFVVATPFRTVCDDHARVFHRQGILRFLALGTRRGTAGVPPSRTRLNPAIGLCSYAGSRLLGWQAGEDFRSRLLPWFDGWVGRQLQPGDHLLSSYGYVNGGFKKVRAWGGRTFLDGGNSHIEHYWSLISDEHRRWKCAEPPFSSFWYDRARRMMDDVDFVFSPSGYVTKSFLERGFSRDQVLYLPYPVDTACFSPGGGLRPKDRPLRVVSTGSVSLRKGFPYLLEAFRIVLKTEPTARLLLTASVSETMHSVLARYSDLPIDWSPPLPHSLLADRLRSADVFALLSLEEGLVRTALEAMACGLPVVVTPHTGVNDFVRPGDNGEVVPIRDPQAAAEAILKCWELRRGGERKEAMPMPDLSFAAFENRLKVHLNHLADSGVCGLL